MKRRNIPMSFADYELLEKPFGWKVEYWDGQARFTPRGIGVKTRIDLTADCLSRQSMQHTLIPVDSTYTEQMIEKYIEVFSDSVEFCGWPLEDIKASAVRDIQRYFAGKRGEPLPASVVAIEPNSRQLMGLALFILKRDKRPHLELLYVRSQFQRQGIATAMVLSGINHLRSTDFNELFSAYHICNLDSRQWHHKFGFQDVYDVYYIRLRLGWLHREIWRREKLGDAEEIDFLIKERDQWQTQLDAGKYKDWDSF